MGFRNGSKKEALLPTLQSPQRSSWTLEAQRWKRSWNAFPGPSGRWVQKVEIRLEKESKSGNFNSFSEIQLFDSFSTLIPTFRTPGKEGRPCELIFNSVPNFSLPSYTETLGEDNSKIQWRKLKTCSFLSLVVVQCVLFFWHVVDSKWPSLGGRGKLRCMGVGAYPHILVFLALFWHKRKQIPEKKARSFSALNLPNHWKESTKAHNLLKTRKPKDPAILKILRS